MSSEVDGAEYLRRLKRDEHGPQLQPAAGKQPGATERRTVPRYKCQGSAHLRVVNSDISTWGSITDISLHGCYIEMANTHPVGTSVTLTIEIGGNRVETKGEVRASYPFLGMGIAFCEMSAQDRLRLADMVVVAGRDLRLVVPHAENFSSTWRMPQIADPQRLIDALESFFVRHRSMSREEFARLASSLSAGH